MNPDSGELNGDVNEEFKLFVIKRVVDNIFVTTLSNTDRFAKAFF